MTLPKKHWLVRKAKQDSTCYLCKEPIARGDSITRWGRYWPHFQCAKAKGAASCAQD